VRLDRALRRTIAAQAAAWVWLATPALMHAQLVRGELIDSVAGSPVAAAIVSLVDASGEEHVRLLTDAMGQFRVRAPSAGEYRLRVRIVGFDAWESEPLTLAVGQTVVRRIPLMLVRVKLPAFTVEAERTCVVRPEEGAAAAALWEEVKKALAATELTVASRRFRFRSVSTERELNRQGMVVRDTAYPALGYSTWPFAALDPDLLSKLGFVQATVGGPTFYGPDAQVLVSDAFLDDHCFRITTSSDRAGTIGLAFEPVAGRSVPEVGGVLWLDSATVTLRTLEWEYRNLSRWAREGKPGGEVHFAQLTTGAWFIQRWMLRAPIAQVYLARADTAFYGVKWKQEEVIAVLTADGKPIVGFERVNEVP
jgi:hypothetical protein